MLSDLSPPTGQKRQPSRSLVYAGIGSRQTPPEILSYMAKIAGRLANLGYVLRSGAAAGADSAFEAGCVQAGGNAEIWLPWKGFRNHADTGLYPTDAHAQVAATVHPAWGRLEKGPRALHGRNVGQVLGADVRTPASFVLCYTADGCEVESTRTRDTGGTGTAIVLAGRHGIPVFNLENSNAKERLARHVLANCRKFHPDGSAPAPGEIFVFGSNLAGRHGKGSALVAKEKFGAIYGQGIGRQGQSYAIPTKDGRLGTPALADPGATLPISAVNAQVQVFIEYAKLNPTERFFVVRLGCQLAAHTDADVAPLFVDAPLNCSFPDTWAPWLSTTVEPLPPGNEDLAKKGENLCFQF